MIAVASLAQSDYYHSTEAYSSPMRTTRKRQESSSSLFGGILGGENNTSNNNNNSDVRIELFDPSDTNTLSKLQDCRRTAFDATKQNFLNSETDFINAKSAVEGKNLCAIAIGSEGEIIGSADLTPKLKGVNTITNVFVRPDRRGEGIGKLLMEEGIETVLANALPEENKLLESNEAILSLDVYTQNTPAITMYQKMGYEPSSPIHSGTLAVANALNSNLVVSLSKKVSIDP